MVLVGGILQRCYDSLGTLYITRIEGGREADKTAVEVRMSSGNVHITRIEGGEADKTAVEVRMSAIRQRSAVSVNRKHGTQKTTTRGLRDGGEPLRGLQTEKFITKIDDYGIGHRWARTSGDGTLTP